MQKKKRTCENAEMGAVLVFMPSSSYKTAEPCFRQVGLSLNKRAILDSGSRPTCIRRELLPVDNRLRPLGDFIRMFH